MSNSTEMGEHIKRKQSFISHSHQFLDMLISSADPPCYSPNISLLNLSPQENNSVVSIRRSKQFLIRSKVILDCELSHKTAFNWSIYQVNAVSTPVISKHGTSELRIAPHMLPVGSYLVRLIVTMVDTQVFGVSQGYIKVISSPLVALISGGTKVARGFNKTLVFNASMSYDPDEEKPQSSSKLVNYMYIICSAYNLLFSSRKYPYSPPPQGRLFVLHPTHTTHPTPLISPGWVSIFS